MKKPRPLDPHLRQRGKIIGLWKLILDNDPALSSVQWRWLPLVSNQSLLTQLKS